MNIYDEAKQELIEIETYLEHSLEHIDKALERAKKVEELVEDYKYLLSIIDLSDLPQVKIIKHKEKELEELK